MSARPDAGVVAAPEALRFALWVQWTTRLGLVVMVTSFAAYMSGLVPVWVPSEALPGLWSLPLDQFLQATRGPTGWGWLGYLMHGDFTGLSGIAIVAGGAIPSLLALVPLFRARGERSFVWLCAAEAAVLAMAASGLLAGGH